MVTFAEDLVELEEFQVIQFQNLTRPNTHTHTIPAAEPLHAWSTMQGQSLFQQWLGKFADKQESPNEIHQVNFLPSSSGDTPQHRDTMAEADYHPTPSQLLEPNSPYAKESLAAVRPCKEGFK